MRRGSDRGSVVGTGLRIAPLVLALAAAPACAQSDDAARRLTLELAPRVERATGLTFRREPRVAVRSRDQLRAYLERKVRQEYPPAELRAQERVYKAFGLVPDTTDLLQLQLDVLQEQVAGFYDPDSSTLFLIRGGDPALLRAVISHELVHALQDQYTRLAPILRMRRQNDRQMAAQAVMEGQATLAGLLALAPGMTASQLSENWGQVRRMVRMQQESAAGAFASAPRILREGLIFPYIFGAEFMIGFESRRAGSTDMPYGERLPQTTEQVLHASKYSAREPGLRLAFAATRGDTAVYDDDFGEFDTRVALESWGTAEGDALAAAGGWNGDRYEVRGTRGGTVVLWASAWDTAQDAQEFERALRRVWERGRGASQRGNRWQIDVVTVAGATVVRLADAPAAWTGWARLPSVRRLGT